MDIIGTCLDCAPAAGSVAVTVFVGIAGLILGLLRGAGHRPLWSPPRR